MASNRSEPLIRGLAGFRIPRVGVRGNWRGYSGRTFQGFLQAITACPGRGGPVGREVGVGAYLRSLVIFGRRAGLAGARHDCETGPAFRCFIGPGGLWVPLGLHTCQDLNFWGSQIWGF